MEQTLTPVEPPRGLRLGAVVGGVMVALVAEVLFLLGGAAIGLTAFTNGAGDTRDLGIGFAVWLGISLGLAAAIGAFVASRGGAVGLRRDGALYGVVTWAGLSLVVLFLAVTQWERIVAGSLSLVGGSVEAAAEGPRADEMIRDGQEQAQTTINEKVGAAIDNLNETVETVGAGREVARATSDAAEGLALGLSGAVGALLIPLGGALLGGILGARGTRRLRRRIFRHRVDTDTDVVVTNPPVIH
jgi:hypothetical protein